MIMYMIILLLTKTATRKREGQTSRINPFSPSRPFTSSHEPLYQNKVKCSAFNIETFHSHANKTHFGLILKVKVFGTCKRPIRPNIHIYKSSIPSPYISLKNYWKNLFKEQSIFPQVIILYILITFSLDFVLMLLGENRYWSLLGLKRELLTSVRTTRLIHQSRQF